MFMFKRFRFKLFALLFGLICSNAPAQVLWGNTEKGMTIDQVMSVVENVELVQEQPVLNGTAIEKARVNSIMIAGADFHAGFYFSNDKLDQVSLMLNQELNKVTSNQTYDLLLDALRSKYGKETLVQNQGGAMLIRNYTWIKGRVNITASLLAFDDEIKLPPIIQIAYQTKIAESADNL